MQWSVDRNGGFSRADPAKLVLPPIMDPIYGFQAVNVEAQASDPHSLLNWMRRMLAVRQRHIAFGRGTQRFLYPGNRKVLVYLREHTLPDGTEETLLCVSNLSRSAQAVELDLSAFAGRVPVDIVGGSIFPAVGQLPYLLTLPPYAFYWFLLASDVQLPSWHTPQPEALPELSTIVLRRSIEEVQPGYGRQVLETESLPIYLPKRRWYASKTDKLLGVRIAYAAPLNAVDNVPVTPGEEIVTMSEIEARFADRTERYALPMGIVWEDEVSGNLPSQLALARVRRGPRVGFLTDGFAVDSFARAIMRGLRDSTVLKINNGTLQFRPTSLMASLEMADDAEIRRLSAEQSNSSMIIGDAVVMKVVRRVSAGIHPEGEITRFLTERGFSNTAPLYGEVVRVDDNGTPNTIGIVQGFVRNQGDGWGWTLDFLSLTVDEAATTDSNADINEDAFAPYAVFAAAIGRRLGELHSVFASPSDDPAFAPEYANEDVLEDWATGAIEQLDRALDMLRGLKEWPDATVEQRAFDILNHADALRDAARKLAYQGGGALKTRVHGDFHLGQVLVVQSDAYLIDFEGEPARTMEQRRAKSCPIRDVAGLLRSFDYAAAAALPGRVATSQQATARRAEILAQFRTGAEKSFLAAYREVLEQAEHKWVTPQGQQAMLDLFLLEKAAYEIRYEAANRPTWLGIPLQGLHAIATRLLGLTEESSHA
jgi:maltose alpha-D-glucosyltransferase/alpha-amylase